MRVAVLGGTGRTGRYVVDELLRAGHVPVVVGRSARLENVPTGADAAAADVSHPDDVHRCLTGCTAVIIALSIPRTTRNPFAPTTGPSDLHSRSMQHILRATTALSIRRIVKVSAQGVGPTASRAGWGFRALVAVSSLKVAFDDHAVADGLLLESDRDATVLHPPMLVDGPPHKVLDRGEFSTFTWTRVTTGDVARTAVAVLEDETAVGQRWTLR